MAVCAYDVTFVDLIQHALPVSITKALADRERLVGEVVELQDEGIVFPAVDARVCAQELHQIGNPLPADSSLTATCPIDIELSIRRVVRLCVCGPAASTEECRWVWRFGR